MTVDVGVLHAFFAQVLLVILRPARGVATLERKVPNGFDFQATEAATIAFARRQSGRKDTDSPKHDWTLNTVRKIVCGALTRIATGANNQPLYLGYRSP